MNEDLSRELELAHAERAIIDEELKRGMDDFVLSLTEGGVGDDMRSKLASGYVNKVYKKSVWWRIKSFLRRKMGGTTNSR